MDVTRFRSFAERYVIERASTFKADKEMEDAWSAVERAKSIYKHIENVAMVEDTKDREQNYGAATQAAPSGATGIASPGPYVAPHSAQAAAKALAHKIALRAVKVAPSALDTINSSSWTGRGDKP